MAPIFPLWADDPDDPDDRPGVQTRLIMQADPRGGSTTWMDSGACHGSDPELFFPISATGRAVPQINSAKAICGQCPVSEKCLSYALRTMPDGIWGGTTREERVAIRLQMVPAPAPAEA